MHVERTTSAARSGSRIISGLLTALALFVAVPAAAQDQAPWPVKGKLLGAQGEKSEDVSGIACTSTAGFPRACLLIDDDVQGAQVVIVRDGEITAGQFIPLIDNMHDGNPLELDGEGVAYAGDGVFYVMGSHGHPRDKDSSLDPVKDAASIKASIKASSQVVRVKIDPSSVDADGKLKTSPAITRSPQLRKILAAQPDLKPFMDKRLDQNGLTIEGIAVRDKRLFAGMRGPLLAGDQAAIVSVAIDSLFEGGEPDARLQFLDLRGRGIRDLAAFENGFLVLAGPAAEADGKYAIYFWDGEETLNRLAELPKFTAKKGKQAKPEAVLTLDSSNDGLRVLVLFDGPKEGSPRALTIPAP